MSDVIVKQLSPVSRNTQLSNHDWQVLMRIARANDMLATLAWHIDADQHYDSPEYINRAFQSALVYQAKQRHQVEQECISLHQLLIKHDIKPVFLKGASYIINSDPNSFGRTMSDLDILVHEHELNKVEAVLRESGWKMKELNEYDEHYYRSWSQELPPMYHPSTGTTLDIHHNLLPSTSRRHFSADFLHHNIEITEEHNLATLNLEYRLIHCVIHLFCNEEFDKAARDFFDIHALLEKVRVENKFKSLFHEATKCNCSYEVALSVLIDQQAYCGTYSDDEIRYCNKVLGLRGKIKKTPM